jgi:DNA-binding transcriptional LysR family regulator
VLGPRREIAFREVLDHDFVGFVAGSALQKTLNHHAARAGRRLKLRVRLNSFDSIARMVESGIGLPSCLKRRSPFAFKISGRYPPTLNGSSNT